MANVIIGISGASGAIYAQQVVELLTKSGCVDRIALIISDNGRAIMQSEGVAIDLHSAKTELFDCYSMFASPASGSSDWDSMAIVPCSVGCLGRIAAGVSGNLIERAADVMLKERRRLVLVPREMPLSTIHLRNMTTLSECGATILPASPSFYFNPSTIEELCRSVAERVVAQLGIAIEHSRFEPDRSGQY